MKRIMFILALATISSTPVAQDGKRPRQVRVSQGEVARQGYTLDLTRRGTIFDLDLDSGTMDFSLIKVQALVGAFTKGRREAIGTFTRERGVVGTFTLQEWLLKQWPPSAVRKGASGRLRIGWTKDFAALWESKSVETPGAARPYECVTQFCSCSGRDDCGDMFREDGPCAGSYSLCEEVEGVMKCTCGK